MSEQIQWNTFKQTVFQLQEQNKYDQLLDYFKANKRDFQSQIANDTSVLRYLLKALRKSGNSQHIFSFLEAYGITISDKTEKYLLNEYGWGLLANLRSSASYSEDHGEEDEFSDHVTHDDTSGEAEQPKSPLIEKIVEYMQLVSKSKDDFYTTLISALFTSVLKAEKRKPTINWRFINEFCDLFDPESLSAECMTIQTPRLKKKTTELASDRETWYAAKVKSLYGLGNYRLCQELAEKALDAIPRFHYSNDAWFARWIALSLSRMGDSHGAISRLEKILKRKRDWFIQKELAELHHETGNLDEALKMALEAVNNFGEIKYKVDLLRLLSAILKDKGQKELAFKHLSLSKMVRRDEGWTIPQALINELESYKLPEIPWAEFISLKNALMAWWKEQKGPTNPHRSQRQNEHEDHGPIARMNGVITRILHDNERGKFGFIKFDGDRQASFNIQVQFPIHQSIHEGIEIEFSLEQRPDGKYCASNIRLKT